MRHPAFVRRLLAGAIAACPLSTVLIQAAHAQTYSYDTLGRLTGYVAADGGTVNYNYDAAGNRTQVVSSNRNPLAANDSIALNANTSQTFDPRVNDSDAEGDPLTITAVTQGAHGGVAVNGGASLTYTPSANYSGPDSFTYTVSDGRGGVGTATVTVSVNGAPVANADSVSTYQKTPVSLDPRVNDSEPDGDPLTIVATSSPAHGGATYTASSVTYTPAAGYVGTDNFTYTVSDGRGSAATGAIQVNVVNRLPVANTDGVVTNQNTAVVVPVLDNDTDPDGDVLSVASISTPAHGAVVNNGTSITYTPAPGYAGADAFTYVVSDGKGGTATGSVSIGVNDRAPVATDDSIATNQNTAVVVPVLANDTDPDGDTLSVASVSGGLHGTLVNNSSSVTYTPAAGYVGTDSFTYIVSDGKGGTAGATVSINIVNRAPVANNDAVSTNQNTAVVVPVLGNDIDPDSDAISVASVSAASHGATANNGSSITYTPAAGYVGTDSFTYVVSDGKGGTAGATVSINVVNRTPAANNDSVSTNMNTAVVVSVLANDSDPDGDGLSVASVSAASHGATTNNGSSVTYTPADGYYGADSFTYVASDGKGGAASASVSVSVVAVPPTAGDVSLSTGFNAGGSVGLAPGGVYTSLSLASSPAHGSASLSGATVTYTPSLDYYGADSLTYVASGPGGSATGTISINVASPTYPAGAVMFSKVSSGAWSFTVPTSTLHNVRISCKGGDGGGTSYTGGSGGTASITVAVTPGATVFSGSVGAAGSYGTTVGTPGGDTTCSSSSPAVSMVGGGGKGAAKTRDGAGGTASGGSSNSSGTLGGGQGSSGVVTITAVAN